MTDVYYYTGMNKQEVDVALCTLPISYHRVCIMVHKNVQVAAVLIPMNNILNDTGATT